MLIKEIVVKSHVHGIKNILVDEEDYDKISSYKWWIKGDGKRFYAVTTVHISGTKKSKKLRMHRLLFDLPDSSIKIDHINGNGLDNRRSNLRMCSNQQNISNSRNTRGGVSKYKGVWYRKDGNRTKPWSANIKVNYKKISLGVYLTEDEAAKAYNDAAIEYFGDFAEINNVP